MALNHQFIQLFKLDFQFIVDSQKYKKISGSVKTGRWKTIRKLWEAHNEGNVEVKKCGWTELIHPLMNFYAKFIGAQ